MKQNRVSGQIRAGHGWLYHLGPLNQGPVKENEMQLTAPDQAPVLTLADVHEQPVVIGAPGKRTLLCFFRDPACPFCNFRIFELTSRYEELAGLDLDIIAVFSATAPEVRRFAASRPRPFPVIADPDAAAYTVYGVERISFWGKLKAIITRVPTLIKGLRIVGLAGLKTSNLMPADFLIDEDGRIVETWYGRDAGDRIPFERVMSFLAHKTRPAD